MAGGLGGQAVLKLVARCRLALDRLIAVWGRYARVNPLLADGCLAASLAAASCLQYLYALHGAPWRLPLVVLAPCALLARRRLPLLSLVIQEALDGSAAEPPMLGQYLAFLIGIYSVGVYSRRRLLTLAVVLASVVLLQRGVPTAGPPIPHSWLNTLVVFGVWVGGAAIRAGRGRADALTEHADALQREQELAGRIAVADERARIARELHDVVAHSVSIMVVQAGAARRTLKESPENLRAAEALRAVEAGGREALTELRRLLGVLAVREHEAELAPQPGLDQLDALLERVKRAGLSVSFRIEGERRPLPAGADLTAYRVVQEALTNALKHAAGAQVEVVVRFQPRQLQLEIVDTGGRKETTASSGAGHGLIGMRERLSAFGGELDVGPRMEGGFAVRARLPLEGPESVGDGLPRLGH